MAKFDNEYLKLLIKRLSAYKSPNDAQKLILALGNKTNRTVEDDKKLSILLKAEKKLEQLNQARSETRKLLQDEKNKERKKRTRKMIIWGNALTRASVNDNEIAKVMRKLINDGYISESDKAVIQEDLDNNQAHSRPTFSS